MWNFTPIYFQYQDVYLVIPSIRVNFLWVECSWEAKAHKSPLHMVVYLAHKLKLHFMRITQKRFYYLPFKKFICTNQMSQYKEHFVKCPVKHGNGISVILDRFSISLAFWNRETRRYNLILADCKYSHFCWNVRPKKKKNVICGKFHHVFFTSCQGIHNNE